MIMATKRRATLFTNGAVFKTFTHFLQRKPSCDKDHCCVMSWESLSFSSHKLLYESGYFLFLSSCPVLLVLIICWSLNLGGKGLFIVSETIIISYLISLSSFQDEGNLWIEWLELLYCHLQGKREENFPPKCRNWGSGRQGLSAKLKWSSNNLSQRGVFFCIFNILTHFSLMREREREREGVGERER